MEDKREYENIHDIATAVANASYFSYKKTNHKLMELIKEKGEDFKFEFPDTIYALPQYYGLTGKKVETLGQMQGILEFVKGLLYMEPDEVNYKPYLGETIDAGMATLLLEEVMMAIRYVRGLEPMVDKELGFEYNGFITDTIMRQLGIKLVDGTMPGFAAYLGKAPSDEVAVQLAREAQEKGLLTFLSGSVSGDNMARQLVRSGVEIGWDFNIVPLGPDTYHTIYALDWAIRSAMMFGGKDAGDYKSILKYLKDRVFAFAVVLGKLDDLKWATGAGAIGMGFPAIVDTVVPEIRPTGICTNEHVVVEMDHNKILQRAIEVRGLKIVVDKPPIPVAYSPAFEGERVRKADTYMEFGGQKTEAFEWLTMCEPEEVEDGKVEVVEDVKSPTMVANLPYQMPLGIVVEVAGKKMQPDFQGVIERKIHEYLNFAQGVFHMGQRNMNWIRISKDANKAGFTLKDLGVILNAAIKKNFQAVVDKIQTTLYTDEADVLRIREEAMKAYQERDDRVAGMTDEAVDTYYSCHLCQSFAPAHVCIVTPERLGLCGAFNWMDCKAAHEMDPVGGNQPIKKKMTLDPKKGRWLGVDQYLFKASGGVVESMNAYTIMENPMTSCGCFEVIGFLVPEANGIMLVQRGHADMTPTGMKFSTLAGTIGGGMQVPGSMGIGRNFILSGKFIYGDGGLKRVVWMTKALKEYLNGDGKFTQRAEEEGVPDLLDKIADETVCTDDTEKLVEFLTEKGHPALEMEPMF